MDSVGHQQCSKRLSSRLSACHASRHVAQKQMSAGRRQQHPAPAQQPCAVVAHDASCSSTVAVHPSCPSLDPAHANGGCSGNHGSFLTGIAASNAPQCACNGTGDRDCQSSDALASALVLRLSSYREGGTPVPQIVDDSDNAGKFTVCCATSGVLRGSGEGWASVL